MLSRLGSRPWPGNVRELENAVEMLVALSADGELDVSLLDDAGPPPATDEHSGSLRSRVAAFERRVILEAIDAAGGNKAEAARALGIGRVTLYDKLRRLGITA